MKTLTAVISFAVSLLCSLVVALAVTATVALDYFTARSNGNVIVVEWQASTEQHIVRYEVERSTGDRTSFKRVGQVEAKGSGTMYRYNDESAFMRQNGGADIQAGTVYYYRLRSIGKDNSSSQSDIISVTHNVSSVRRTWGMIKEMFR